VQSPLTNDSRPRRMASLVLTAAWSPCRTAGATAVIIASVVGLIWAGPHAGAPAPEEPPGSGIVTRTEVTAVWVPRSLRDLARRRADPPAIRSTEEMRDLVRRCGRGAPWYALTWRGYQVNGESAEITQIRLVSEIGRPPRRAPGRDGRGRVETSPR
jgi:hypothetical protein